MPKPTLATCSLAGCFGCHMSLLDIDERLFELLELVDLDRSPFDDKKEFDGRVDIGLIEGGCANEHDVALLRRFREQCGVLVSVGACAINGGVPAMRNPLPLRECLEETYLRGPALGERLIPDDDELPRAVAVRVCVLLGGPAVRRPSRVPDAVVAGDRVERDGVLEARELAGAPPQLDLPVVHHGHSRRVVAPVFEPPQPIDQHGHDFLRPDVSDDSTHYLLRSLGPHPQLAVRPRPRA